MNWRIYLGAVFVVFLLASSCSGDRESNRSPVKVYKGLYIFGPEIKTFTDCMEGMEVWAADSSNSLELAYSNLNFEKPYEPVYVEVEGKMVASEIERSADFDSTLIVHKVIKISKQIPPGACVE